jgi:hypothetical protein
MSGRLVSAYPWRVPGRSTRVEFVALIGQSHFVTIGSARRARGHGPSAGPVFVRQQ